MTDPAVPPDEDVLLAAEYAFGLVDRDARSAVEARIGRDAEFAGLVGWWQDHAARWFAGDEEQPPPSLWPRIAARIAANDPAVRAGRSKLLYWQIATAVASIAAIGLGGAMLLRDGAPPAPPPPPVTLPAPPAPPLVAILHTERGAVQLAVSIDRDGRLTTNPSTLSIGNHAAELWVIPADGKPRSLGVVSTLRPQWRPAPVRAFGAISAGTTLAISVEPIGGSPTGQPTGAVILTGEVRAI